ncbi:MAG: SDR family oxidoreductase [Chloroflexota bacterium]
MPKLQDKVVIVTGSGKGIGESIAKLFAAEGATVVVATLTAANGQATVDEIVAAGGIASLYQIDIGQVSAVQALVDDTVSRYGRLDVVVHNAGIYPHSPIETLPDEMLDQTLDVNLKACFWLTRAAVPHLRKQGGGRILITSSVTGPRVAMAGNAHYAASKGGVNGFIRTAALEFAKDNITVNGVEPGFITTAAMLEAGYDEEVKSLEQYIPMGKMGDPEDIAHPMLFLASDEARYITGQTIIVDGGSTLPESPVFMTL